MIRWSEIKKIEDVATASYGAFDEALKGGLIVYYDSNSELKILSGYSLKSRCDIVEHGSSDYYILENNLCLKFKNEIRKLNIETCETSKLCSTGQNNISLINSKYCRGGTTVRNPKRKINEIVRIKDNEVVYSWENNKSILSWSSKYPLFYIKEEKKLLSYDIWSLRVLWEITLDSGFSGVRYVQAIDGSELIIERYLNFGEYNLLKLDVSTGAIRWEIEKTFDYYNFDSSGNKLYGLGARKFEAINAETGEREMESELKENLHVAPHLTFYAEGYLYFSGYLDQQIPVFGAVHVETGELDFIQEVEMPGERSFRKGLDRPVVVGNRLYVRDAMKVLHVFERQRPLL